MDIPTALILYKYRSIDSSAFRLPILDDNKLFIGDLQCIDIHALNNLKTISLLTKWRNQNMEYFLTQFEATSVRTRKWLEENVLPADNRIIFLVCDEFGEAIGNIGLCNASNNCAEIDNVLRGEMSGNKKLFYYAMLTILCWVFQEMNIPIVNISVFSNNTKAIKLYERVGFSIVKIFDLSRVECGKEISHVQSESERSFASANFKYQEMTLERAKFMDNKS
jgi:RimJ/RimL family protein N-acetyltransferase